MTPPTKAELREAVEIAIEGTIHSVWPNAVRDKAIRTLRAFLDSGLTESGRVVQTPRRKCFVCGQGGGIPPAMMTAKTQAGRLWWHSDCASVQFHLAINSVLTDDERETVGAVKDMLVENFVYGCQDEAYRGNNSVVARAVDALAPIAEGK